MSDSKTKLSCVTVALHWVVGITMIVMLAVGLYMTDFEVYALYPIHKSVGMIVFVTILARVVWRIKQGWAEAGKMIPINGSIAGAAHETLWNHSKRFAIKCLIACGGCA